MREFFFFKAISEKIFLLFHLSALHHYFTTPYVNLSLRCRFGSPECRVCRGNQLQLFVMSKFIFLGFNVQLKAIKHTQDSRTIKQVSIFLTFWGHWKCSSVESHILRGGKFLSARNVSHSNSVVHTKCVQRTNQLTNQHYHQKCHFISETKAWIKCEALFCPILSFHTLCSAQLQEYQWMAFNKIWICLTRSAVGDVKMSFERQILSRSDIWNAIPHQWESRWKVMLSVVWVECLHRTHWWKQAWPQKPEVLRGKREKRGRGAICLGKRVNNLKPPGQQSLSQTMMDY